MPAACRVVVSILRRVGNLAERWGWTDLPLGRRVVLLPENSQRHVYLTPEEVGDVWDMIEDHIKLERKTLKLAEESLKSIEGSKGMLVQAYLLGYLLEDEKKHNLLLDRLADIQKGMYPYA